MWFIKFWVCQWPRLTPPPTWISMSRYFSAGTKLKSIVIILNYTISKLVLFLRHSVPVSIVTVSSLWTGFFCHIAVELCVVVSVCQMMSYSQSELLWLWLGYIMSEMWLRLYSCPIPVRPQQASASLLIWFSTRRRVWCYSGGDWGSRWGEW